MTEEVDEEVVAILKADEAHHAYVRQHDRYCITVNAGFPDKSGDPAKVIDEAIHHGLSILVGGEYLYMRLVSVTTTVLNASYGQFVLVTVIAEPLPLQPKRKAK
ncbi:MAG TPA: hypothetical protein VEL31_22120 [Ktedonobacteraceae bacterium]|nr:hypothetical protein [Ktedonobacteraceae bacterium]